MSKQISRIMALLGVQGYRSVDLDFVPNILNICQKWLNFAAAKEAHTGCLIGLGTRVKIGFLIQSKFVHKVCLD